MPKERTYGVGTFLSTGDGEPAQSVDSPLAEVRWNRWPDSYVSLVTRLESCEVSPPDKDILASYGFHVQLDRDGINSLMRHLRRARDQAFGRDE